jgi:hypothetical protein
VIRVAIIVLVVVLVLDRRATSRREELRLERILGKSQIFGDIDAP